MDNSGKEKEKKSEQPLHETALNIINVTLPKWNNGTISQSCGNIFLTEHVMSFKGKKYLKNRTCRIQQTYSKEMKSV